MYTKQAQRGALRALARTDWDALGNAILTPEVLGAIIGGTGAPLITYLVRRKKEMPAWQRVAELLGAGVLGAGAGAGIGYGGKHVARMVYDVVAPYPPELSNRRSLKRYVKDLQHVLDTSRRPITSLEEINRQYSRLRRLRDNTKFILEQLAAGKDVKELGNVEFLTDAINEIMRKEALGAGLGATFKGFESLDDAMRVLGAYADSHMAFIDAHSRRGYSGTGMMDIENELNRRIPEIFNSWGLKGQLPRVLGGLGL